MSKAIHLAILVAGQDRAALAIEELWRTAKSALPADVELKATVAYASEERELTVTDDPALEVLPLRMPPSGKATQFADSIAASKGPVGVMGRLLAYNLSAQRVARALSKNAVLAQTFRTADVVVSADPQADLAVWKLRRKTAAPLVHGPNAMVNALLELARA